MKPMACRVAQEGFIPWERLYGPWVSSLKQTLCLSNVFRQKFVKGRRPEETHIPIPLGGSEGGKERNEIQGIENSFISFPIFPSFFLSSPASKEGTGEVRKERKKEQGK